MRVEMFRGLAGVCFVVLGACASAQEAPGRAIAEPSFGLQPVDCTHRGSGRDLTVGPGQTYPEIADVPWESLGPGDTVRIFWRSEPYQGKIAIGTSGTADQPIRVCGVSGGPGDERPVITGDRALTRPAIGDMLGRGQWNLQPYGLLVIFHKTYGRSVEHVAIEGLHLTGTLRSPYGPADVTTFYNADGIETPYLRDSRGVAGAAGIYIQRARHIVLRGNEISRNAWGILTLSQDYTESHVIRDILVEGNVIRDNGVVGSERRHQAYLQGVGFVVQFNYFGSLVASPEGVAAPGINLKLRSVRDVIRYNYFENGVHAISMVDVEDHRDLLFPWLYARARSNYPAAEREAYDARQAVDWAAYADSFVYGNVFRSVGTAASANPVRFGFDNSAYDRRPGRLWFYFNTVVIQADNAQLRRTRLFSGYSDDNGSYYVRWVCPDGNPANGYNHSTARMVGGELHFVAPPPGVHCEALPETWTDWGPMLQPVAETFPKVTAVDNAIVLLPFTPGALRFDFELTRFRADQLELGRNWISSGWTQDVDSSTPWDGLGNSLIAAAIAYPGANDAPHVTGLSHLIEKMQGQPIYAHVNLEKGERSHLAELASNLL